MVSGGKSAFRHEFPHPTPPHPARLPASEMKQTFLSTNLASLLALARQAAGPTFADSFWLPTRGCCTLAISGFWGLPSRAAAMTTRRGGCEEEPDCPWLAGPERGIWGDVPSSCRNRLFRGSSLFLPCLALAANVRFSLVERKHASGRADELQDQVGPPVCTWANFSFEHEGLFGHFANWF